MIAIVLAAIVAAGAPPRIDLCELAAHPDEYRERVIEVEADVFHQYIETPHTLAATSCGYRLALSFPKAVQDTPLHERFVAETYMSSAPATMSVQGKFFNPACKTLGAYYCGPYVLVDQLIDFSLKSRR